jgi:hypothetical protein
LVGVRKELPICTVGMGIAERGGLAERGRLTESYELAERVIDLAEGVD